MATEISLVVPYRPDGGERDRNWRWLRSHYETLGEIIEDPGPTGPFSRAAAINAAVARAAGGSLIVVDADTWLPTEALEEAVAVAQTAAWVMPHLQVYRLNEQATQTVIAGADPEAIAQRPEMWAQRPYRGVLAGGCVVIQADHWVPMDERFVGWGQEETAWAMAVLTLQGRLARLNHKLVHLWHQPQPRLTRRVGNREGRALHDQYTAAHRNRERMRALVDAGAST